MPEVVIRTAPLPGEEATFSIAFGGGIDIAPLGAGGTATQAAPVLKPHKMPIFAAIDAMVSGECKDVTHALGNVIVKSA